ncbi:MAG: hypothetical protein ACYC6L_03780 [Anaerolineae bacterium]
MPMQYGRIIKHAWQVTWHKRALWLFGITAALFAINLTRTRILGGWRINPNWLQLPPWVPFAPQLNPSGFSQALWSQPVSGAITADALSLLASRTIALIVLGLLIFIVSLVIRLISQGAMIGMVDDIERRDQTSLGVGFKAGGRAFLDLLLVDILIGLAVVVMAVIFGLLLTVLLLVGVIPARVLRAPGIPTGLSPALGLWGVFVLVFMFIIGVVLVAAAAAVISIVRMMAQREVVLGGHGAGRALGNAVQLFRMKLGQLGIMWLLLFSINLALSLVTLPLTILGAMALALPFQLAAQDSFSGVAGWVLGMPLLVIIALTGLFINGVYTVFRSTVWTLAYREAVEPLAVTD